MSEVKKFTLIRYDRLNPATETDRLRVSEPEGYEGLEETLSRDTEKHGIFFEYSSDLTFVDYYYDDEVTGLQVDADAYTWLKQVFDTDFISGVVRFQVEIGGNLDFDLYLDFDTTDIDTRNRRFTCKAADRQPFLLKTFQEQKVQLSTFKNIRLRQKTVNRAGVYETNNDFSSISQFDALTIAPPLVWDTDEDVSLLQWINQTSTTNATDKQFFFRNETIQTTDITFIGNFDILFFTNLGGAATANITIEIIKTSNSDVDTVLFTYNDVIPAFLGVPGSLIYPTGNVTVPEQTVNLLVGEYIYINITTDITNSDRIALFRHFGPLGTSPIPFTCKLEFKQEDVLNGTLCSVALLRDAVQDVLTGVNPDFTLSSTILNEINDLGSISLTLGRRIAQATENTEVALSFKDLFEELQKIFFLGMSIEGNDIVIEDVKFFYNQTSTYTLQNDVVLEGIEVDEGLTYNVFEVGYDKYKEEDLGLLQENESFNSRRDYNLDTSPFEKKLNIRTKYIASNWIIEKLRRDVKKKNDEDIFLIALNRASITSDKYSSDGSSATYTALEVAEGFEPFDAVSNDYGGLDREGIINIRLSPRRIAERWKSLLRASCFRLPVGEQIATYIDGEPKTNILIDGVDEESNTGLSDENALFAPLRYKVQTYFNRAEYEAFKTNRNNVIQFDFEGETYRGFILESNYNRETELAEITLKAFITDDFAGFSIGFSLGFNS